MLNTTLCVILSSSIGGAAAALACSGCVRDDMTWGGGAPGESWTYVPGAGDSDGQCTLVCGWDKPCKYTGTLRFRNGGTGPRDVIEADGDVAPGGAGIAVGGAWGPLAVSVTSGCGATGDAAGQYQAHDAAGNLTSAYMFYCTGCFED